MNDVNDDWSERLFRNGRGFFKGVVVTIKPSRITSHFVDRVCEIVSGQRFRNKLSAEDTSTFIQKTKSRPDARLRDIQRAVAGEVSLSRTIRRSTLLTERRR